MNPTHNPPADITDATPADLLRNAARYLQLHGWHQGSFYPFDHGTAFPPACSAGAIRIAVCGRRVVFLEDLTPDETRAVDSAQRLLAAYLDHEFAPCDDNSLPVISDWNDYDGRTAAEVIEVLTDAADDWYRLHTPGGGAR